jgi:homogentisate 1,2-dioxygenase
MVFYRAVGDVPPKRHTQHRDSEGRLYREELMGEEGFSSDSSLLYHRGVPSSIVDASVWELPDQATTANHPLTPRHLRLHDLFTDEDRDLVTGRRLVLGNNDVRLSYVVGVSPSPHYRNAVGDECVYIESGTGVVETVFGLVPFRTGDYVLVPRATTHRWVPDGRVQAYAIEANSHIGPPRRYRSKFGQLLEHSPYSERDLHGPSEPLLAEGDRRGGAGQAPGRRAGRAGGHPDVLRHAPVRRGRLGRLPVSVHVQRLRLRADHGAHPPAAAGAPGVRGPQLRRVQLRAAQGGLPPVGHSRALLPLQRRLRRGDVLRRRRLRGAQGVGHRQGVDLAAPGRARARPQPAAIEASLGAEVFDELAVMVDTFAPLRLGEGGVAVDDGKYAYTWSGRRGARSE